MTSNQSLATILAIDTSCDDTSAAVTSGYTVLSNVVASQTELHKPYGGVFPTVAKQAHKENIDPVIKLALKRARVKIEEIDAIAVTKGPGLAPALEVGIKKAKELAKKYKKPLIAVNHVEGHLLSVLAKPKNRNQKQEVHMSFRAKSRNLYETDTTHRKPNLGLVISGGHSDFILVRSIGNYERLGWTIDDATGEALDKIGRILGLGYPAAPVMEKLAQDGKPQAFDFPLPLTQRKDYCLSFSGLKTFARNLVEELESKNAMTKQNTYDLCASVQYAVFRHINYKLSKIISDYPDLGELWLSGGVARNISFRESVRKTLRELGKQNIKVRVPYDKRLCTDNAAMIGVAAKHHFEDKTFVENIDKLERKPRWKLN